MSVFNTSTEKEIFRKTKYFLKKLEYRFLVESTKNFHTKLACQKPMLRQIEWRVQNGPITKKGVLPATTLFFWKFCFSLKTWYKELIWCTNQMSIFKFFKGAGILFESAFSLWISLNMLYIFDINLYEMCGFYVFDLIYFNYIVLYLCLILL